MKSLAIKNDQIADQRLRSRGADGFRAEALGASAKGGVGYHVILDLYGASALDDIQAIERCLRRCVAEAGATLIHLYLHPFATNGGVSGIAVLTESHISIHTWPEYGYAAADVFMCDQDGPRICVDVMREMFTPGRCVVQEISRGDIE